MENKSVMKEKPIITPNTKVREILDHYPELEPLLLELTPAFRKLKNPVLRNTIARVTSLRQAAAVGNISVDKVVNSLRKAAGMDEMSLTDEGKDESVKPVWFDETKIAGKLDARKLLEAGKEPLGDVLKETTKMEKGQIFMFSAPFYPAPLIDKLRSLGFECWTDKKDEQNYDNYAFKP